MAINRGFFFDQVNLRLFDGRVPARARETLEQILDYWESNSPRADDRWLAYALGTAHHETDRTFGPIREYDADGERDTRLITVAGSSSSRGTKTTKR
jgi:hypothetical protein